MRKRLIIGTNLPVGASSELDELASKNAAMVKIVQELAEAVVHVLPLLAIR